MTCDFGLRSVGDKTAEGKGDVAANREEAFKWYLKAAEQGHPDAQDRLAKCYYKGDGIAKDTKKAAAWFLKAAEQFGRIIHAMQVRTYAKNLDQGGRTLLYMFYCICLTASPSKFPHQAYAYRRRGLRRYAGELLVISG